MRYIRSSNQIASKNKTYAMADITEVQMYEWVKTQEVDLAGFQAWIHHHMTLSHQEGYVQGFDTAVVSVDNLIVRCYNHSTLTTGVDDDVHQ